jgi:membrane protease YdiL (CAAX protease family)
MTVEDPYSPPIEDLGEPVESGTGDESSQPWPPAATLLWGVLLLGGYFLIQAIVAVLALVPALVASDPVAVPQPDGTVTTSRDFIGILEAHLGLIFTIGTAVGAPLVLGATLAVGWWGFTRRGVAAPRPALRASLGLTRPRFAQAALWTAVTAALLATYEWLARLLDRPSLPDFMVEFHASAGWLPGLLFVVVFVAPLVEEVLFRGFLLPGLAAGRLGPTGAVAVTALLFALVHTQYDPFDMSAVLALGLLLGAARWLSGSLWLAYGLHAAINAVAAAQLVWALGW